MTKWIDFNGERIPIDEAVNNLTNWNTTNGTTNWNYIGPANILSLKPNDLLDDDADVVDDTDDKELETGEIIEWTEEE